MSEQAMVKVTEVEQWELDRPQDGDTVYVAWPYLSESMPIQEEQYHKAHKGEWMDPMYEMGLVCKTKEEAIEAGRFVQAMLKIRMVLLQEYEEAKHNGTYRRVNLSWWVSNDRIAFKAPNEGAKDRLNAKDFLTEAEYKSLDLFK